MEMKTEYMNLLKAWVDRLISLQVKEDAELYFRGGIMCPSCAKIHGRCGDAVLPLMYMASVTQEDKYVHAAKELFDWSERNIVRADNSYINDSNNDWRGITIFSVIALAETMELFADLLDETTRRRWFDRLAKSTECIYHLIDTLNPNVNYPISCAAALAITGKIFNNTAYMEKARRLAHSLLQYINEDGLIYGEGKPELLVTEKGCQAIDIGYNVEESLPALVLYSRYAEDETILRATVKSLYAHQPFLIPDGGWNNSWGTRNAKWSYWGSRTSDGCQLAYGLLGDIDPVFGEIAYRNFKLMETCTQNGLLLGGPMYAGEGEPACVHHTFCHAKGLALMLAKGYAPCGGLVLPLDTEAACRSYENGNLVLVAMNEWKASVSTTDYPYCPGSNSSGGCLTFLWHKSVGPILVATMPHYSLHEPANMQIPKRYPIDCQSFRIVKDFNENEQECSNINDVRATMSWKKNKSGYHVQAQGKLSYLDGKRSDTGYSLSYLFNADKVVAEVCVDTDAILKCPIVSDDDEFDSSNDSFVVRKKTGHSLHISFSGGTPQWRMTEVGCAVRAFNPVGGMRYLPLYVFLEAHKTLTVEFSIK
jgi:hypothetical protein